MLEYQWGNQMIPDDEHDHNHDHNRTNNQFYDHHHYFTDPTQLGFPHPAPINYQITPEPPQFNPLTTWSYNNPMLQHEPDPNRYMVVPKAEPVHDYASRIGLNLGGRTYFSSAESEFLNRLYRRSEPAGSMNVPRCQAEGCYADLTGVKHYHRRHKVCEFHSKAAAVVVAGITQRFCQQCSRFHVLTEFDNGKRSCRKRLADHNRRRRKSNKQQENSHTENALADSLSDNISRSPQDSGTHSTSSVTMAISPPRISLDCFHQRSYQAAPAATSSPSTSSLFFTID